MPINKEFEIQHYKKIQIAVSVASKEASHQTPLILPTSVGRVRATIENYRKGKKTGCVTYVRQRDGLLNTGQTAVSPVLEREGWVAEYWADSCVTCVRERDGLLNTGQTAVSPVLERERDGLPNTGQTAVSPVLE